MAIKVGISGYGRIARVILFAAQNYPDIEIVGINKRNANLEYMAYQLRYDSVFGRYPEEVGTYENGLTIGDKKIPVFGAVDIADIPWSSVGAEYVIEATGAFLTTEKCMPHITSGGAKKVVISAPAKDDTPTFVHGVNDDTYTTDMQVVSNASCTTNCLAPLSKVINDEFGIEDGLMSTIHAVTAKQVVVDHKSEKDWRRGRSVFGNIIPTSTGAAKAVGKVIPELLGKMNGLSYRVPVIDVSLVDLNVHTKKATSLDEINAAVQKAAEGPMKGILEYVDDEVVSVDFRGDRHTSIYDKRKSMELNDHTFKLVAYYDNEFGYSSKTLELIEMMAAKDHAE